MPVFQAAPRVLLSPMLLGTINAYQPGCYLDMRAFTSVASPLNDVADILRPRFRWRNGKILGVDPFVSFDPVVTAWYAEVGHSRLTKLFDCMPRMRDIVVAHAVYSGNVCVLTQLPVDVIRAVEIPLLDLAALKGHLYVVQYLHADVGHNGCTTWAADSAALQGHVDIVAFLLSNRREGCSQRGIEDAARNGHLDIVKLFHEHDAHLPHDSLLPLALETAVNYNHFAIVSYIVDMFPAVRLSTDALDGAARDGQLDMVQFLHELNFECTTNAMDWAAAEGHLAVVKWLHENRSEGCTKDAMDNAAREGFLAVVQWLDEHCQEGCSSFALILAIGKERWAILAILARHCDRDDVETALEYALESKQPPPDLVADLRSIIQSKQ